MPNSKIRVWYKFKLFFLLIIKSFLNIYELNYIESYPK